MFASLNPPPLSGRGLTVAQTMAPRGSFELGNEPVMRIAGREPAYWRAEDVRKSSLTCTVTAVTDKEVTLELTGSGLMRSS